MRHRLRENNDGAAVAEPEHEIEQLRAEVELLQAGHPHLLKAHNRFPGGGRWTPMDVWI
jgi:hypothetical protein